MAEEFAFEQMLGERCTIESQERGGPRDRSCDESRVPAILFRCGFTLDLKTEMGVALILPIRRKTSAISGLRPCAFSSRAGRGRDAKLPPEL